MVKCIAYSIMWILQCNSFHFKYQCCDADNKLCENITFFHPVNNYWRICDRILFYVDWITMGYSTLLVWPFSKNKKTFASILWWCIDYETLSVRHYKALFLSSADDSVSIVENTLCSGSIPIHYALLVNKLFCGNVSIPIIGNISKYRV